MQNANPPRRPGRPRRSSTAQAPQPSQPSHARIPSASALNSLSNVAAANSIANSNVTTSHFLGSGALQRPWMKPNAATARLTPAVLASTSSMRTNPDQPPEERTSAPATSTIPALATESVHPESSNGEETRLPSHRTISPTALVPASDPASLQNADSNRQTDVSNSNTSVEETAEANEATVQDLTSTEHHSQPVQSTTDSQAPVSTNLPILDMSEDFHLLARNNSRPSTGLNGPHPSGSAQDNRGANHTLPDSSHPIIRSNASAHEPNGVDHARTNSVNSLTPDQLMWASFHTNATRPTVRTDNLGAINHPPHDSSTSNTPLQQALNPNASPAQLLTPEPSPLNCAAPLAQNQRPAQRPPQAIGSYQPRTASVHVQGYTPVVPQSVSRSRNASVSSVQSYISIGTDARLRGLPQIQGDNFPDNRNSSYLATLETNIQDMSRRIDLNNYQWNLRLPWLRGACHRGDLFFLHLNQFFCMWNMSVATVRHLGLSPDCDSGFKVMELLFGPNTLLPRELLAFMGGWPNSTYSLEANEQMRLWTSELIRFLPILGSNWIAFRDRCLARRVPPMMSEIVHYLACPLSLMLPRAIFCSIQKSISPVASQDLQSAAFNLFNNNAAATYRDQPGSAEFQNFNAAYQAIYVHHLANPQLSQSQVDEIKFVLHRDLTRTNIPHMVPSQATHVRTPSMQMSSGFGNVNAAGPTMAAPRHNSMGGVVSDDNCRFSRTQYSSSIQGPFPLATVQHGGQLNSIRQRQDGSGHIQNNYIRVNGLPPRPGPSQQPPSGPGPIQGNYMRMHNLHQAPSRPMNVVPGNSNSGAPPLPPNLTLQTRHSLISPKDTLLPAPGGRLPDLLVNPDPVQESLHQVLLRQPVTQLEEPVSGDCQRLFQFIKTFALKPYQWVPALEFISVEFEVPKELLNRRPETIEESKGPFAIPKRVISIDSVLFNLRCAKLSSLTDTTDLGSVWAALPTHWPQHIFISINAKHLEIRRKRHNVRDLPVDVTPFIRPGKNEVGISIHPEASERNVNHGVAVEVIGFCDYNKALALPTKVSAATSLKAIVDAMKPRQDADDDDLILVDDAMIISITDPFSSRIFTTPVRGMMCKHRECFDLESLLNSRQSDYQGQLTSVYAWQCPICKSDARPQHLVIDGFFQEVRDKIVQQGCEDEARAIIVKVDGSWEVKQDTDADQTTVRTSRQRSQSSRLSSGPASAKRMRQDGGAVDGTERPKTGEITSNGATINNLPPQNSRIAEIIELD